MRPLTNQDFQIVHEWEQGLQYKFSLDPTEGERNFQIIVGVIHSRFNGVINKQNLDAAVIFVLPLIAFERGFEHPIVKKQLEKKAETDAKAEADARALEASRQRELKTRAGVGSNQSEIRTELDRCEFKPKLAVGSDELAKMALKDLTNDSFLQEAANIINNHRGVTHGSTSRQQEILRKERDRLIKARANPQQVRDGVKRKQDSFYDNSVR